MVWSDGVGYWYYETETGRVAKFDEPAVKIVFEVAYIVRSSFLLERGLRFHNLGFCAHDLIWPATFNA
jgi:hypothetical protein